MIMSHPAFFSSAPKKPPELEEAIVPVSGPLVTTMYLPPVGAFVPVAGPVAKINLFAGDSGSTVGGISSNRYLEARPLPPTNCLAHSMLRGSTLISPVERLTLRIFPVQPPNSIRHHPPLFPSLCKRQAPPSPEIPYRSIRPRGSYGLGRVIFLHKLYDKMQKYVSSAGHPTRWMPAGGVLR